MAFGIERRIGGNARVAMVCGTAAAVGVTALLAPRFGQPAWYHNFADQRAWEGIRRAGDVISNVAFLAAGLVGFAALRRSRFHDPRERLPWLVFFAGMTLTAFGSTYYHLAPDNARLFWDRLPITIAFMALLDAVIAERISGRAGRRLLLPLLAVGAASAAHWLWTEQAGHGDLRFYAFVQLTGATLPYLILLLYPARYTRGADFLWAGACYGVAKATEVFDKPIFSVGHIVSGHTLKHVFAAGCGLVLARMLARRQVIGEQAEQASVGRE